MLKNGRGFQQKWAWPQIFLCTLGTQYQLRTPLQQILHPPLQLVTHCSLCFLVPMGVYIARIERRFQAIPIFCQNHTQLHINNEIKVLSFGHIQQCNGDSSHVYVLAYLLLAVASGVSRGVLRVLKHPPKPQRYIIKLLSLYQQLLLQTIIWRQKH